MVILLREKHYVPAGLRRARRPGEPIVKTTLSLRPEEHAALWSLANREGVPMSVFVGALIRAAEKAMGGDTPA